MLAPTIDVEAVLAASPEAIVASGMGEAAPNGWTTGANGPNCRPWPGQPVLHPAGPHPAPHPRILDGAERLCGQLDEARAAMKAAPCRLAFALAGASLGAGAADSRPVAGRDRHPHRAGCRRFPPTSARCRVCRRLAARHTQDKVVERITALAARAKPVVHPCGTDPPGLAGSHRNPPRAGAFAGALDGAGLCGTPREYDVVSL